MAKVYKTIALLEKDYERIAYRPAKKGELIIAYPNMFTGFDETCVTVRKVSHDMKYIYSSILKKKEK